MKWTKHLYRVGSHSDSWDELPSGEKLDALMAAARKRIEPWLSAVFQAEHLNLFVGSGFTTAVAHLTGASATGMGTVALGTQYDNASATHAEASAALMNRTPANIEDQFRSALAVWEGLRVIDAEAAEPLKSALNVQLSRFLKSLLVTGPESQAVAAQTRSETLRTRCNLSS